MTSGTRDRAALRPPGHRGRRGAGIGFGISLNPGVSVGIDFEARDVAQMAALQDKAH